MTDEPVVIVGAGQAGAAVAARLRSRGHAGRLTLVGDEGVPPYQRPPLSKGYLLGDMARDRLFLRPGSWYAENDIDLLPSDPAIAIDRAARTVALHDRTLGYGHLVLATGATPRSLPADIGGTLANVQTVRGLACIDTIAPAFATGARGLVIGGGYIGLEAAAVAASRGVAVTLIELAPRILARVAAPETASWFHALHARHGVDLRVGTGLVRLLGKDAVTGARLTDGSEIAIDFAIVGIGVAPHVALAQAAGLPCDNGILVNAMGRTADPRIWSAGDCAAFPWRGRTIRLESVQNAIDGAETVADNIMGAARPYDPDPWFWSDQYDVKLQIAGLNAGYDSVVVRLDGDRRSHWYYAGDRLLSVDAMNDARTYMIAKRMIEQGIHPASAAVADPAVDLKALLNRSRSVSAA